MTLNPKIFKSYDIRGIYPDELNEATAFLAGQAYANLTGVKKVAIGRDMRIGSDSLGERFAAGLADQGVNVDDLGQVPIDAVYFSVGHYKYDGGIMVTASHNPKEYNGFKMVVRDNGIEMIRGNQLYEFLRGKNFASKEPRGEIKERDVIFDYLKHVLSFADMGEIKPFKIVVDAGNGMAGKVMPLLFAKLPCRLIPLNFELDGNFPAHPSNPLLPESKVQISEKVREENANFGIIMDGDTDRLFFTDEKGEFIQADTTLLILAKYFLKKEPGAGIAYNAICSRAVREKVKDWGGRPLRAAVGFVNVAKAMKDNGGIMGGEVSAHYCFRDNYYADSGFIAFVILLALISKEEKKLSEIVSGLNPYYRLDEINMKTEKTEEIIAAARERFKDGAQDELDGLTVEYKDWWINIRPSNTEPLLRITIEGETKEIAEEKEKEVREFLEKNL
ncbi:MAG: phosphomannomutase/phosphoglucomutase [Patescibacteria group bacterium]|nr:phosphomannomutase/phosphoglucomutase [Patescibacteria group bacterium]